MKIYSKQEWYSPAEISVHNHASDCWISLNGKVLDMTNWLQDQFRLCRCTKTCSCPVKRWYCGDQCVEYCDCFKRGFIYCDAKRLASTILAYAGKDVSHWFNGEEFIQYTHLVTTMTTMYQRHGHGMRQPVVPSTHWRPVEKLWWEDESLVVGKASARTRPIKIVNTLTDPPKENCFCQEQEGQHRELFPE